MKIGIIGSGIVGRVLASAFLKEGHEVMLGSRSVSKPEVIAWLDENKNGSTGTFVETAGFADIIVLAVGGDVALQAFSMAGDANTKGKIIIDATNPIAKEPPVNGV